MRFKKNNSESKTMTHIPFVEIEYVNDISANSCRRTSEVTELLFQMLMVSKKRGRPSMKSEMEISDAA